MISMDKIIFGLFTILLFHHAVAAHGASAPGQAAERKDYPITPARFTKVKVTDAFWLPRIETNRAVTLPFLFKKNEDTGRLDNFAIAGGLMEGK
jgi:hypothetical protein